MGQLRMPFFQSVRSLRFGLLISLSVAFAGPAPVLSLAAQTTTDALPSAPTVPQPPASSSAPPAAQSSAPSSVKTAPTLPATQATPPAKQAAPSTAPSQTPSGQAAPGKAAQDDSNAFTLKTSVNEVNLIFTVTDKHGKFINDLQPKDFALLDNQKPPSQVYSFSQQTNLPLRVGLLIDASTSIRLQFKFEQQAATEFLLQVLRPQTDRAFIMGFNAKAYVTQDYTNNPDALESGINKLQPAGGTALYDAIYTACRDKLLSAAPAQATVRKALIVVSDGDDNQSRAYLDDAIKECQRAQAEVYTISTNSGPSRDRGDDTLNKISLATGGTAFFPHRIEDISNEFNSIQLELRSQYALAYKPADFKPDGSFRTIYFEALDRRYNVRAPKGYFATQ
jgi:Ca-activated chloride channel family protein